MQPSFMHWGDGCAPSKFALVRKELLLTRCAEKWEMMIVKRGGACA